MEQDTSVIPRRGTFSGQAYKLFDHYNPVHIFVEDLGFENLYLTIFKKYSIEIHKVFSKNGKEEVLAAASSCTDPKCIFIIDKDWDDLKGCMTNIPNLICLERHSIENYLLDYSSFAAIVQGDYPRSNLNTIFSESDFIDIVLSVSRSLRPLFQCFAAIQMSDDPQKGCSHKPGHFQKKDSSCTPDDDEISSFVSATGTTIPQKVIDYFSDDDLSEKGHGKFMLHFVWEAVRNKSRTGKIAEEKLMIRLAQLIDSPHLKKLTMDIFQKAYLLTSNFSCTVQSVASAS